MPSNSEITSLRTRPAAPTISLKSWPLRDEPVYAWTMLGLEICVAVVAMEATNRRATGLLILFLLLAATWQLWLPMTLELNPKGIIRSILFWKQRIAWSEFSRYEPKAHGVFLRHFSDQMPFGAVIGLFLPHKPPHTELLAVLDHYMKPRSGDPQVTTQTLVP